ncbi:E3 ubiquitin-protein ligase DDB_G0292642-like [Ambystoma mexicanum]|uniref:E3 ubiquitin-protein ligase DDB_G0292642-like n=1 Tax=Ambystoma mexicanum TaxID=8296 RepID=UPI0037E7A13A
MSTEHEKRFDPADTTLKFVRKKDDITGDDDDIIRVEMSCGHAVDPNSLTGWCRSLLDQGSVKFHCPADVDGKKCGKEWTYVEIRRHALLTDDEQRMFEEKMALIAAKQFCEYKECPGCKSYVERKDLTNLRVLCIICRSMNKATTEFCWQCMSPWKGAGTSSDRCENPGCADPRLKILEECIVKDLPGSEIKNCPSIRACPTCGVMIEHKTMCKFVVCIQCHIEFCFACLEIGTVCKASKPNAWYKDCTKPIAPRQTKVPVWSQRGQQRQASFRAPVPPHIPPIPPQVLPDESWCVML